MVQFLLPRVEHGLESGRFQDDLSVMAPDLLTDGRELLGTEDGDACEAAEELAATMRSQLRFALLTIVREGQWDSAYDATRTVSTFDAGEAGE